MKSDEVKQLTTRYRTTMYCASGCSEELTRYLAAISRFHRYSLHNVMLITLQKPAATHSQTEGRDLPNIGTVGGDPLNYQERLAEFVAAQGIALHYAAEIAPARGVSEGGKITLLPGMSPAETFATLVHECADEMLHRKNNRAEISKCQRETEGEAVAFVVCRAIGLDTGNACQNYIQLYRGNAALLMESLENVRIAASCILVHILVRDSAE